uniref:Uncharacterized protein n=1 Tax=Globodera rostochiensis TaxID=31243 RepID=A0A914HFG8_GLORO
MVQHQRVQELTEPDKIQFFELAARVAGQSRRAEGVQQFQITFNYRFCRMPQGKLKYGMDKRQFTFAWGWRQERGSACKYFVDAISYLRNHFCHRRTAYSEADHPFCLGVCQCHPGRARNAGERGRHGIARGSACKYFVEAMDIGPLPSLWPLRCWSPPECR